MENTITGKPLALVSAVAALMLLSGIRSEEVTTGILGSNVTLRFTFNKTSIDISHGIGLYVKPQVKMAECKKNNCSRAFLINESNATVFYHMTNLSLQDSQVYYVSLYTRGIPTESNRVRLKVTVDVQTTTVCRERSPSSVSVDQSSVDQASELVLVSVLCPLLLLVAALLPVSWCLLRKKEAESRIPDRPIPTVEERVSTMTSVSVYESAPSSVVYSVLDFPRRAPSTVLDMDDTQYATISYAPEDNHTGAAYRS